MVVAVQHGDALAAKGFFSGGLLVAQHGKVLLEKTWGLSDREARKPVTAHTQFRIGSLNKMFTAVAVLQLVKQGKLSLDASVGQYLPDYPNKEIASKVTIRMLLSHTAGTGDFFGPEFDAHRLELKNHADYIALLGHRAPLFTPGTQYRYSNYGFLLLGRIVEKASGQSYYDYVQRNIFAPAGMTATTSPLESEPVPDRAKAYTRQNGQWVSHASLLPLRGFAPGGGLSTMEDLLKFTLALQAGKLLPPDLFQQATSPQAPGGHYGFGFGIYGGNGPEGYGHDGGEEGQNAVLHVYPAPGRVVVAMSNLDPPTAQILAYSYEERMPLH